jgi:hypothetical protein
LSSKTYRILLIGLATVELEVAALLSMGIWDSLKPLTVNFSSCNFELSIGFGSLLFFEQLITRDIPTTVNNACIIFIKNN